MTALAAGRRTCVFVLSSLVMFGFAAAASGQGSEERPLEPGLGYRFVHGSQGGFGAAYPLGFDVQLARDIRRNDAMAIGVVAQYGLSFRSDDLISERLSMLQGGVRLQWSRGPISPYVKGMAGIERSHFSYDFDCSIPGVEDDECEDFGQTNTAFAVGAEAGIKTRLGPQHSFEIGGMFGHGFYESGSTTFGVFGRVIFAMQKFKKRA